jgi:hypothetical protein
MKLILAAVGLFGWSSASSAATIMVQATSNDSVGQSIVYNLRNEIARSALHTVVYDKKDAGFVINIITLKQDDGRSSVYAASLLMPPFDNKGFDYYITGVVGVCGSSVTKDCGPSILASFDSDISEIVAAFTKGVKK